MLKIAINGFGRIGRNFLRAILIDKKARNSISVAAINIGPGHPDMVAHMLQYDSLMGIFPEQVTVSGSNLKIADISIPLLAKNDPSDIKWSSFNVDWVVESSGHFTDRTSAQRHLDAGAKHVLITAPAKNEDVTIIPGVNDAAYDPKKHYIVALGSCTTNALMPMLKVLHEQFGIKQGLMTTVHAYTNSQVLLDVEGEDPRRSRAAAINIIPTSTGVSHVIEKIFPNLKDRIKAVAIRVPVPKVSLIDFAFLAEKLISAQAINDAFAQAAHQGSLKGILDVTQSPLVSSDFNGNPYSVVIDSLLTDVSGQMGKVFGWYDNEWAFSVRLKDFLLHADA